MAAEIHWPGFFCLSRVYSEIRPEKSSFLSMLNIREDYCLLALTMALSLYLRLITDSYARTLSPREAQSVTVHDTDDLVDNVLFS
jgi:hypothetical protein